MSLEDDFNRLCIIPQDMFKPDKPNELQDMFKPDKPNELQDMFKPDKPKELQDMFKPDKPKELQDMFKPDKPKELQDTFKPTILPDKFKEKLKEVSEQELSLNEIIKRLNNNDTRELTSILIGPKINEDQNYYECSLKEEEIDPDDLENPYKYPYMEDGPFVKPLDESNGLCVFLPCNEKVKTPKLKIHFNCMCITHQTEVNKRYGYNSSV
jgi:hypothetical protein